MAEEMYRRIELEGQIEGGAGLEFLWFEKGMRGMRRDHHVWVAFSVDGNTHASRLVLREDRHGWQFINRGWEDLQFIFNDPEKMAVLERAAPQLGAFLERHFFLPLEREEALARAEEINRLLA